MSQPAALILHDRSDTTHWLSPAGAKLLLTVVLCLSLLHCGQHNVLGLSRFAHAPADCPLPSVIYNRYEPSEGGVTAFWRTFYADLLRPDSDLTEDVGLAQRAAAMAGKQTDWGAFSLLIRGGSERPFRIEATPPTADRFAAEIQAQFAANSVNRQAGTLWTLGSSTSGVQRRSLYHDLEQASGLLKKLL